MDFSGGVDSSLLTAAAHEVPGDRLIAVTGADASVPAKAVLSEKVNILTADIAEEAWILNNSTG